MKKTTNIAFCALAALCLGGNAYAGSWSARGDFSLAANPNGVWSYGSELTLDAFSAYSTTSRDGGCGNSKVSAWSYDVNLPFVMANNSGTDQICAGYITIPIDVLHMHPGGDGSYSVTRWTAPESGIFEITGFFEGLNARFPTTTDDHLVQNGTAIFDVNIHSANIPTSFDVVVTMNAGDTLDFAVGPGDNGYTGDSTGLSATITTAGAAPEPGTMWLVLGVVGFIGPRVLRK